MLVIRMNETDSIKYIIDGKKTDFSWQVRMSSDQVSLPLLQITCLFFLTFKILCTIKM